MFAVDFRDKINRLVNLVDQKKNQFEILVDRIAGSICDFYGLGLGAWVTLVFVASGRFDMSDVRPIFNNDLLSVTYALSYRHSFTNLQIDFVRKVD